MNLDDVLGDKPIATREPVETEQPATDVKADPVQETESTAAPSAATEEKPAEKPAEASQQRDEKGRFAPKADEKPEPMVPLSALLAERAKRREPEATKPKTSVFDDEDKAIRERVADEVGPLRETIFSLQLQLAKSKPGFDDAVMAYLNAAQNDPVLKYQADNAPEPLEFIYREGKRLKELADVGGDIEKYREKVTAQERAKLGEMETRLKALEAENKALKEAQDKKAKVPQSLNSENSAPASTPTFSGPKPLASILNS